MKTDTTLWQRPIWLPYGLGKVIFTVLACLSISLFAQGANNGRVLAAYYPQWGAYESFFPKNIMANGSASMTNVLIYAFGLPQQDGECKPGDAWADYQKAYSAADSVDGTADVVSPTTLLGNFHQLQELKSRYPNLKVLISIGGATSSKAFPTLTQPANRAAFVQSCINTFINGNFAEGIQGPGIFDGIDIDWEYPAKTDVDNFTALLAEFRTQLDAVRPGLLLTAATPADKSLYSAINLQAAAAYLDFFNVMTYNYDGPWTEPPKTGFLAPLYPGITNPSGGSVDTTIQGYLSLGVPANKILMGISFYAFAWTNVPDNGQHGLFQPGTPYETQQNNPYPTVIGQAGFTLYRDPVAQSPWLYDGFTFWALDDPVSISLKTQYANANGLRGMMVWDLLGDTPDGTLLKTIASGLGSSTDASAYNFEGGRQQWTATAGITGTSSSDATAFSGTHSLAIKFDVSDYTPKSQVYVNSPLMKPGSTIYFHVWVPANSGLSAVNPFVEDQNWTWTGNWQDISALVPNSWNTISVTIPAGAIAPIQRIGVEFSSGGPWSGLCYLDSVDF
jgi:chitinase